MLEEGWKRRYLCRYLWRPFPRGQVSMKTVPEEPGIYGRPFPRSQVSTPNGLGGSTADAPNMGKTASAGGCLSLVMVRGPPSTFPGHANTNRAHLGSIQYARSGFSSVLIGKVFGPESGHIFCKNKCYNTHFGCPKGEAHSRGICNLGQHFGSNWVRVTILGGGAQRRTARTISETAT